MKPDVVLYEEALCEAVLNKAIVWISRADVLIICGTSLTVYPAAGLVHYFTGDQLVVINKTATLMDSNADLCIRRRWRKPWRRCTFNHQSIFDNQASPRI